MCYHCYFWEQQRAVFLWKIFWNFMVRFISVASQRRCCFGCCCLTERVDTHIHVNKAVTIAGLHSEFAAFYICSCVRLPFSLLKVSEVFIRRQRQHQLTWQADLKDGEGGARVHSCTHHSAVQPDPWPPRKGLLPASIGSMFPAIVILSCLHLDKALLHKRFGLSSKPEVTGGHGEEEGGGRELRQCPPPKKKKKKDLNSDVSYQLHPYGDA